MPELPEVETVRRSLTPRLLGRAIADIEVLFPGAIKAMEPDRFCRELLGERFAALERYGKYLVYCFHSGRFMVMHLRMTGQAVLVDATEPVDRHVRVRFLLDDGNELRFSDMRKFGRVQLVEDRAELERLIHLGPEPLTEAFTPEALRYAMRGRGSVKAALLDQRRIAGLGNIYADEALFRAGIRPDRPAGSLTEDEIRRLHEAVEEVLAEAVRHGGTTIRNYVQGDGAPGSYADRLQVYGRHGNPCVRCGAALAKMRVAGRGTTYCPECQRWSSE